ncbi:hypothetical protein HanRHA438_Chr16g0761101 [Helianthus annuus]|nr:hypothetical protein HanRHA438_Chr16g0761101 [Helianthus annuus]
MFSLRGVLSILHNFTLFQFYKHQIMLGVILGASVISGSTTTASVVVSWKQTV